ncbi:hypothetical protein [Ureaplasma canigenitalium]|uniref:hypothetical protein n=1 Tax=Ureaplasma canigenitalium TaxID=42092 RepID=UPI0004E1EFE6|nr:hypothetical protein [Ureaplasma canigenitalium]
MRKNRRIRFVLTDHAYFRIKQRIAGYENYSLLFIQAMVNDLLRNIKPGRADDATLFFINPNNPRFVFTARQSGLNEFTIITYKKLSTSKDVIMYGQEE